MKAQTKSERRSPSENSLFLILFIVSLFIAVYIIAQIFLYPYSAGQPQYIPERATYKAITAMESVVAVCILENKSKEGEECKEMKGILETLQSSLDLSAQTSMSQSTFGLLKIGYWQFIISAWTAIFLLIAVLQTGAILKEARITTAAAITTADAADKAAKALILLDINAVFCGQDMGEVSYQEKGAFRIEASAVNYGKSPAIEVLATIEEGDFNHFNRNRFFNEDIYDWSFSGVSAGVIPGGGESLPITKLRELTYRTWAFGEGQRFVATWRFSQLFGDKPEYWQMPFFVKVVYPTRQDYAARRAAAMSMYQNFPSSEELSRLHSEILGLHVSRNSLRRLTEAEQSDYEQKWANNGFNT